MEYIRSFVAIELPPEVKDKLVGLQRALGSSRQSFIKWVNPEGVHLTLKFLGAVPADKIAEVSAALEEAAEAMPCFRLELESLGVFPNPRRTRVAWVGLGGEVEKLLQLQRQVDSHLAALGFPSEERPFTPHLTLARVREGASPAERQSFGERVSAARLDTALSWQVEEVCLMKSQLTPAGAIYSRLATVKLKAP